MENVAFSEATAIDQASHGKKRCRSDMNSQGTYRDYTLKGTARHSELSWLKEALRAERETLCKLRLELEEERGASMTAADEAMAMINRLQEEKSAVLVESRRYKLAAEERESHNQEAIDILKEALLTKEDDLLALQELLGAYREALMTLGTEQGDHLDNTGYKENLLLLEGPNATTSWIQSGNHATYNENEARAGIQTTSDLHEESECQAYPLYNSAYKYYEQRGYEDCIEGDIFAGTISGKQGDAGFKDMFCERWTPQTTIGFGEELENSKHPQEQTLDEMSDSIFARVQRLEERFEHLKQKQALEYQWVNDAFQSNTVNSDELTLKKRAETDWETSLMSSSKRCVNDVELERLALEGQVYTVNRELDVSKYQNFRIDGRNSAQEPCCSVHHGKASLGCEGVQNNLNAQRAHYKQSAPFSDMVYDDNEAVHDVYEVQSEVKKSPEDSPKDQCLGDNTKQLMPKAGSMNGFIQGDMQRRDRRLMESGLAAPRDHMEAESCTSLLSKLSVNESAAKFKDVHLIVADEDVRQLKSRLEALEDERFYLRQAIDSLKKENKELKVLQELAQQLRELNTDARNEDTREEGKSPFFSFFKGVLSFTGFKRLSMEGAR
ncbi:hypothetical protein KP509_10G002600 [Ceratopteris richardii]|nr:hypothetical protein KP509_10G002600 [Ceratopteris richardii]